MNGTGLYVGGLFRSRSVLDGGFLDGSLLNRSLFHGGFLSHGGAFGNEGFQLGDDRMQQGVVLGFRIVAGPRIFVS